MENTKKLDKETKIEVVTISDDLIFQFFYVPKGFQVKECNIEGFKTEKIGNLNSFNRLKLFKKQRIRGENVVEIFKNMLKVRGWDLLKFPNPVVYGSHRKT